MIMSIFAGCQQEEKKLSEHVAEQQETNKKTKQTHEYKNGLKQTQNATTIIRSKKLTNQKKCFPLQM